MIFFLFDPLGRDSWQEEAAPCGTETRATEQYFYLAATAEGVTRMAVNTRGEQVLSSVLHEAIATTREYGGASECHYFLFSIFFFVHPPRKDASVPPGNPSLLSVLLIFFFVFLVRCLRPTYETTYKRGRRKRKLAKKGTSINDDTK